MGRRHNCPSVHLSTQEKTIVRNIGCKVGLHNLNRTPQRERIEIISGNLIRLVMIDEPNSLTCLLRGCAL